MNIKNLFLSIHLLLDPNDQRLNAAKLLKVAQNHQLPGKSAIHEGVLFGSDRVVCICDSEVWQLFHVMAGSVAADTWPKFRKEIRHGGTEAEAETSLKFRR